MRSDRNHFTAWGYALDTLMRASKRTLAMTSTLFHDFATSLFYLFHRPAPIGSTTFELQINSCLSSELFRNIGEQHSKIGFTVGLTSAHGFLMEVSLPTKPLPFGSPCDTISIFASRIFDE